MLTHPSSGFEAAADEYEAARPEIPEVALRFLTEQLCLRASSRILDVGAGTGKITRALARTYQNIIALEPVQAMRQKIHMFAPNTRVIGGVTEAIPLENVSVDAVVAGNSFHWFANATALQEIARVLKPEGRIGLLWTVRDESVDWVAELIHIMDRHRGYTPGYREGKWAAILAQSERFRRVGQKSFQFSQRTNRKTVTDRVASMSFIQQLSPGERQKILEEISTILRKSSSTEWGADVEFPYRTDVFVYELADPLDNY